MSSQTTDPESLLEAVPDALVGVGRDGVIRFVNRQAESLFGYARDELVGIPVETLVPESLRQVHAAHRKGYAAAPATRPMGTNLNLYGLRRDGTEFPADISLSSRDTGDDLVVIAAVRDMTERYRAEEERHLMSRQVAIIEFSGEAITSGTLDGIYSSWNPAAEKLYGYSAKEIIGKSNVCLVPADRAEEQKAIVARLEAGQVVENFETIRVRKDGTRFQASLAFSPIRDTDGTIIGASAIHRDVTEQKQAFDAAQSMAAIVEYSNDAIAGTTLDGLITSWNPAAERLYGYSDDEIIGRSVEVLSPKDRAGEFQDIMARIKVGEHVENFETTRIRKDGTVFPASLTVSPIRDAEGTIIGASSIAHDVTSQREAFELARAMIESSLDPMVTISPEGKITDVNGATVRVTGVPRGELIGTSFSDYFTEPGKAEEIYQRVFTEGMAVDYPLTLRHRDGREEFTDVLYNASVYRDARGKVLGVFAAARDVTEQNQAAQYARSLIEAALDPLVTISPEGTITDVNEATVTATGVPRDELIGTSFSDYFTDPDKAEEVYQRVFTEGEAVDIPLTLHHRDGHDTFAEVLYNASVYRDTSGNVRGVFAAARDVTHGMQAQRELAEQQASALERLAELERFQRLTVGRELRMIELKKEVEQLRKHGPANGGEPGDS